MACEATFAFLTAESGRYMPVFDQRVFPQSVWMNIVQRGEWIPAMGTSINTLVYERSAPTVPVPEWTAITTVPDGQPGGSCLPPVVKIGVASTSRSFNLARIVREGPDICNIDIMPSFDLANQLKSTYKILGDYARIEWEIRYRNEYFRLTKTKVVLDSNTAPTTTSNESASYPAVCATLPLALNTLRRFSIDLFRDGAGAESLLRNNGSPLITVITDSETSGNIIRQNGATRDDIRWSNRNNLLVEKFGINYSFQDFVFLNDTTPRRFSCSGGTRTQIAPYVTVAATKGSKAEINPAWKTATETETLIFDRNVMKILIPRPPTSPSPGFRFDPVDYTGMVKVMNIIDRECNPDGNVIFHRMHLAAATMPDQPERGVAIVHLRCDPEGGVTACAT